MINSILQFAFEFAIVYEYSLTEPQIGLIVDWFRAYKLKLTLDI